MIENFFLYTLSKGLTSTVINHITAAEMRLSTARLIANFSATYFHRFVGASMWRYTW